MQYNASKKSGTTAQETAPRVSLRCGREEIHTDVHEEPLNDEPLLFLAGLCCKGGVELLQQGLIDAGKTQ